MHGGITLDAVLQGLVEVNFSELFNTSCLIDLKNLVLPPDALPSEHNIVGVKASNLKFPRKRILKKLTTLACSCKEKVVNMDAEHTDYFLILSIRSCYRVQKIVRYAIQHFRSVKTSP